MNRYKSKELNKIYLGEYQTDNPAESAAKFISNDGIKFNIRNKTIELSNLADEQTISGLIFDDFHQTVFNDNKYIYALLEVGSDIKLYRGDFETNLTLKSTFTGASEAILGYFYKNKIFIIYNDGGLKISYSGTSGTTWNTVACTVSYPQKARLINGEIYLLDQFGTLYKSNDGFTFSIVINLTNKDYVFTAMEEFQGNAYVIGTRWTDGFLGRIENGEVIEIKKFTQQNTAEPDLINMENKNLIFGFANNNKIEFFSHDIEKTERIGLLEIDNAKDVKFFKGEKGEVFAVVADDYTASGPVNRLIFQINENLGIFKYKTIDAGNRVFGGGLSQGIQYFASVDETADTIKIYKLNTSFYVEQYLLSNEIKIGQHIPIGIRAYFEAGIGNEDNDSTISENIIIKVYGDSDTREIGELNCAKETLARIRKITTTTPSTKAKKLMAAEKIFKKNIENNFDYIKLKILFDSNADQDESPKLKELLYLYLPVGLENAK